MGEVWSRLGKVLGRIDTRGADVSLRHFLARHRVPGSTRALARLFVEGYYAAHVDRVSGHALASGTGETEESQRQYRLADGYFGVVEWLRAGLDPERASVRLGRIVEEVRWRRGKVVVTHRSAASARTQTLEARAAVVTLPLGVLKAAPAETVAVRFDPLPPALRAAMERLEVSHACKVVLRFTKAFWDEPGFLGRRASRGASIEPTRTDFLHDPGGDFPTWWTANPWQVPVITAWAGGPRAGPGSRD